MVVTSPIDGRRARGALRPALAGLASAAVDAALVGMAVGAADLAAIAARGSLRVAELPIAAMVALGLGTAAGVAVGTPAIVILRLVGRHPRLRGFAEAVQRPGPERVAALARLAVWLAALAGAWGVGYRMIRFASKTYHHAGAAALLSATATIAAVATAMFAASWLASPLATALARRRAPERATRGAAGLAAALAAVLALTLLAQALLRGVAPLWDPVPSYVRALGAALLVVAAAARVARRLGRRRGRAPAAAGACALVCAAALGLVGSAPRVRSAVVAHGVVSRDALRRLHHLSDRDGDGFAGRFGGGDCDDGDRAIHPRAPEIPDNGRDDNCMAGDVTAAALAHRLAVRPSRSARAPRRDILLVTVDAVRADHTSAYGYHRRTTPALERLAARGTRFVRAESPSSVTRWSIPAILLGRHPSALPARSDRGLRRPDARGLPTLASTLAGAGYATHAIIGLGGMVGEDDLAGFAEVENVASPGASDSHPDNAAQVTARAIQWLNARPADRPSFLWIHYIDPHGTYQQPAGAPVFGARPVDRYDAEIAHVDRHLGRLLRLLADGSRGRPTIAVVAADHGEAFGDHGTQTHGKSLYEDQTHVPLIVALPGGARRVVAEPVGLVDLAPTLLDLVGIDTPAGMSGASLAEAIQDGAGIPPHPVLSELVRDKRVPRNLLAIHRRGWKLIRDLDVNTIELYDVARDPEERDDRSDLPAAAQLAAELGRLADTELSLVPAPARSR